MCTSVCLPLLSCVLDRLRFFSLMPRRLPSSTLFPYTTLFRSLDRCVHVGIVVHCGRDAGVAHELLQDLGGDPLIDRKSTRLNSSHTVISYAVFCLKKKNNSRYFKMSR